MVPILNHSLFININNNITIVIIEIVIEKGLDIVYAEDKGLDIVDLPWPSNLISILCIKSSAVFNLCPGE